MFPLPLLLSGLVGGGRIHGIICTLLMLETIWGVRRPEEAISRADSGEFLYLQVAPVSAAPCSPLHHSSLSTLTPSLLCYFVTPRDK